MSHITEIQGMEGDVITLQNLFVFDYAAGMDEHGRFRGRLRGTGIRPTFLTKLTDMGITVPNQVFAFETFDVSRS